MSEEDQLFSVTFERDRKLFGHMVAFAHSRVVPRFAIMLSSAAIVPIVIGIGFLLRGSGSLDVDNYSLIIGAVLALLLFVLMQTQFMNPGKFVQEGGWFLSRATVIVSSNGLQLEQPGMVCLYHWNQILAVHDEREHIVFQTDKADGVIIPKSAFPSAEHFSDFKSAGEAFVEKAAFTTKD